MIKDKHQIEEAFHLSGGYELSQLVKQLEADVDRIFAERDGSLEWRLQYDAAMKKWAHHYNELRAKIEELWVV